MLTGRGQFASKEIAMPSLINVLTFTHTGSRNFIVKSYVKGKEDLLVNKIGAYQGTRPIFGIDPVTFDIQADGAWTIKVEPVDLNKVEPSFSGKGDAVSGIFDPPPAGAWEFTHTGQRNFIVVAHCAGGDVTVQNQIGPVSGSRVVSFPKGICIWEVEADGSWTLKPR